MDTESIMTEKLGNQVNGSEWSWKNLNTVRFDVMTRAQILSILDSDYFLNCGPISVKVVIY